MNGRWRFLCGPAAALLAPATMALGGALWPGFNHATQTISQLMARDAPDRWLIIFLFAVYNGLLLSFGLALRELAATRGAAGRHGVRGANRVAWLAAAGTLLLAVPMDPVGGPRTAVGAAHLAIAGIMAALAAASALMSGLWLRREAWAAPYARLSLATVALMAVDGLLTVTVGNLTGYVGLYERLLTVFYGVWLAVMGVGLWRMADGQPATAGSQPAAADEPAAFTLPRPFFYRGR